MRRVTDALNIRDNLLQTRHSLLRRLRDWDDHASWEEFFNIYWRLLYNVATQAGLNDSEAQDVVQETILTVARNIKGFKVGAEHGSFKSWLLRIIRSRIADHFRRKPLAVAQRISVDGSSRTPVAERIPDPASINLEAVWEQNWQQNVVEVAMDRVKKLVRPTCYQMFDLHVLKEWPANKVADKLGVTMGQVYFARQKVERLIKKESQRLERSPF